MRRAGRVLCVPFALSFGTCETNAQSGTPIALEEGARHFSRFGASSELPLAGYALKLDRQFDPYTFSSYQAEEIDLAERVTASASFREDSVLPLNGAGEREAALAYRVGQSALKAQYNETYVGSSAAELRSAAFANSPDAQAEPGRVRSYSLGLEQKFGSILRASIAGFFLEDAAVENEEREPVYDVIGYSRMTGSGYYGGEAELEAKWESGISSRLSYAYAVADENGNPASRNAPKHFGRLNFFLPVVHEILFAGLELQTSSSRVMLAGNDAKEYAVMNTILFAHSLTKGLDVTAILYNMFDSRTSYVGAGTHWQDLVYQDARTFKLKFTYRF